jgi:hypothetical protein
LLPCSSVCRQPEQLVVRVDRAHPGGLNLALLDLESFCPQRRGAVDQRHATAALAAPIQIPGIFELGQRHTERV